MKRRWSLLCASIIVIHFFVFLPKTGVCASSAKYIEFLLDASGSMGEQIEGREKIDIAKEAISSVLAEIPSDIPIGLRAYGHQYFIDKKNCEDTELIVPIQTGIKNEISQKVYSLNPRGYTPIAYSLQRAAQDFPSKDAYCYIILVSDGKETCGGDPVATIEGLKAQGYKIIVHTVGFDVDQEARTQLRAIADTSGGLYMDASNASELGKSLKTITEKIREFRPYKEKTEIEPGSGFSTASLIEVGKPYAYDIMAGEEHFYKFPVNKDSKVIITITMKRKEAGVHWDLERLTFGVSKAMDIGSDYGDPSAFLYSATLYDPDRMRLESTTDRDEKEFTIGYNQTTPQSVRLQGETPFAGEAYLSIGLIWKYSTMAEILGDFPEGKQKFESVRKEVDPSAYYTLKVRILEEE